MALHGLTEITLGVPDVATAAAFYVEFGLTPSDATTFATREGGEQLRLVPAPKRRLDEVVVGVSDADDVARVAAALTKLGFECSPDSESVTTADPGTGVRVDLRIAPPITESRTAAPSVNGPGRDERLNARADAVLRDDPVRPRKLGHVVLGSTDHEGSERFFTEGLGFKVSDVIPGVASFMRCSTDHHNVLVLRAPVAFLHHTAWQVDGVDEIGRGATRLLEQDPSRHVWGLGRHHVGSNFFWYMKDPAGNFCEYYSDVDVIDDDDAWSPGSFEGPKALYSWGPPPPPWFLEPEDVFVPAATRG